MEQTREVLTQKMTELFKEGMNLEYIPECAIADMLKDMYCLAQGWSKWPDEGPIVDLLNDWANSVAGTIIKGFEE